MMDSLKDRQAFSLAEFCQRNGVARSTAYMEVSRGRLRVLKIGKKNVVTVQDELMWRDSLPALVVNQQRRRDESKAIPPERVRSRGRPRKQSAA